MSSAKTLILNAQDSFDLAKKNLADHKQHEFVGYNLAQACENFMKALCEMRELEYPHDEEGHDLDALMQILEEGNLAAISSLEDIIQLNAYNGSGKINVKEADRVNLSEFIDHVEDLKKLVAQEYRER